MARRTALVAALLLVTFALPAAAQAAAHRSPKKGLWGPVTVGGRSQFPIYEKLGAGILSLRVPWSSIAPSRPAHPRDPADPAYVWPAEIDQAFAEAARAKMKIALEVRGSPPWANGGRDPAWAPTRLADWRNFVAALVRRYPRTAYWIIWAEASWRPNFRPEVPERGPAVPLDAAQRRAPHRYAELLDAAYAEIHHDGHAHGKVVGGNSFVGGDISPLNWIRNLRLPDGRRPRMDLYGHHPFTARKPDLAKKPIVRGLADFSDLDTLAGWLDRYGYRDAKGHRLRLYLGEWTMVTDHRTKVFNVWVTRKVQASWLRAGLAIAERWRRIAALVYFSLYDQPPVAGGLESDWGLLDWQGRRKPAFSVFANG